MPTRRRRAIFRWQQARRPGFGQKPARESQAICDSYYRDVAPPYERSSSREHTSVLREAGIRAYSTTCWPRRRARARDKVGPIEFSGTPKREAISR